MKGVMIFAALILAGCVYVLGNFDKIADPILAHIVAQEGSVDSEQDAAQQADFTAKYQPFLDQHYWLGRVSRLFDDNTFLLVSGDAWNRYNNTPLQYDPEFAYLIFQRAQILMGRNDYADSGVLYEQYMQLFPNGPDYVAARGAMSSLRVNHGIQ